MNRTPKLSPALSEERICDDREKTLTGKKGVATANESTGKNKKGRDKRAMNKSETAIPTEEVTINTFLFLTLSDKAPTNGANSTEINIERLAMKKARLIGTPFDSMKKVPAHVV